jgi:predicted MFS family arabinose efflux permease
MIAAILPRIAGDLAIPLGAAGQLVTAFTLAYAIGSPVLTTLAGTLDRGKLLIGAMLAFAVANVIASLSSSYGALMLARILIALAAGPLWGRPRGLMWQVSAYAPANVTRRVPQI